MVSQITTNFFHLLKQQHCNYAENCESPAVIEKHCGQLKGGPGGRQEQMKPLNDNNKAALPFRQKGLAATGQNLWPGCFISWSHSSRVQKCQISSPSQQFRACSAARGQKMSWLTFLWWRWNRKFAAHPPESPLKTNNHVINGCELFLCFICSMQFVTSNQQPVELMQLNGSLFCLFFPVAICTVITQNGREPVINCTH